MFPTTQIPVSLVKIPTAWHMANILFLAPGLPPWDYWCLPDGIPQDTHTDDPCHTWGTGNTSLACEHFGYRSPPTVVTEWDLVCHRQVLINVSQFFYLLGILVGGFMCTMLLHRFAPRSLLTAAMCLQVCAGVGAGLSTHLCVHIFMRCLSAVACAHMFTAGYVICTHAPDPRRRLVSGCCYELPWSAGVVSLACIAAVCRTWRHLQLAISLPTVLLILCYRLIPEAPVLQPKQEGERAGGAAASPATATAPVLARSSAIRPRSVQYLALHVAWAAVVVTYYGALLNVKNVGGDIVVNTMLAGAAEVLGVLLALPMLLWCPHACTVLAAALLLVGAASHLGWYTRPTPACILLTCALSGRVVITCALSHITVLSSELLTPEQRKHGMLSVVTCARVCLLTAPFIGGLASHGAHVPLAVFGSLTMVAGAAILVMAPPLRSNLRVSAHPLQCRPGQQP